MMELDACYMTSSVRTSLGVGLRGAFTSLRSQGMIDMCLVQYLSRRRLSLDIWLRASAEGGVFLRAGDESRDTE